MTKRTWFIVLLMATLALAACSPAAEATAPPTSDSEPAADANPTAETAPTKAPTETPGEEPTAPPTDAPAGEERTYQIVSGETGVRFEINEVLNGQDARVIGSTSNAATGEIVLNRADTSSAAVRNLTVDISGLQTDNNFRNRALHDFILQTRSGDNATVTFEQTGVSGLPAQVEVGQTVEFQLTGNLTIHGTTNEVTFAVSATPVSETRIEGTASSEVLYPDFGINIPRLPDQVASVEENVTLVIEFAAEAQ